MSILNFLSETPLFFNHKELLLDILNLMGGTLLGRSRHASSYYFPPIYIKWKEIHPLKTPKADVFIIFRRNLNYERKIFPSVSWFFSGIWQFEVNTFTFLKVSKRFYGLVECTFDNPDKNFLLKVENFFAQNSKKNYKIIIFLKKKYFSPKFFYGHVECSFDNTAEHFYYKIDTLFDHCQTEKMLRVLFTPTC